MPAATRQTKQKQALRDAFVEADRPLSPEEVLALAKQRVPGMSIATVYRNVGALVEDKWLAMVELPGAAPRYEIAGKQHHHHFQCNDCEKVYELAGCDLPLRPSLPRGFRVTGHEFFLYGTCADCR
ncbi:MAG: Fur family transcriptional regulator [Janthinobacterium lividum]